MFSKAKRFEALSPKNVLKNQKKWDSQKTKIKTIQPSVKSLPQRAQKANSKHTDTLSQCSSTNSIKSFVTPKPVQAYKSNNFKKINAKLCDQTKLKDDIVSAQEVEIRNKDETISEYSQQIDELKNEIARLQKKIEESVNNVEVIDSLNNQISQISINDEVIQKNENVDKDIENSYEVINNLKNKIYELECHCNSLQQDLSSRQVEMSSFEEIICIRDSLCKDLQDKLTEVETNLEENKQRLEMVKGHHALALEANESIRKEYKVELETLKAKYEEEKLTIINKSKIEQDNIKCEYQSQIDALKSEHEKEKADILNDTQQQILLQNNEMKAKLDLVDESATEKLRLCEIQFEERYKSIQDHWVQQRERLQFLENETRDLKYSLNKTEKKNIMLQEEINNLKTLNETLENEKLILTKEVDNLKDISKVKFIDFENQVNKLTLEVDKVLKEKHKFETSLTVTREIVQVLTTRLRESDNEIDSLESKVKNLSNSNKLLEKDLLTYKNSLGHTMLECNEYKEALVNILKSKAALAKEHNRIMEHNVTLIESLQNVEKEAYRELGTIQNEVIEDVELLKKESSSQIQLLRDEVKRKQALLGAAQKQAHAAAAATAQAQALLAHAADALAALEADNLRLQRQIEDQQSLVVELSLLRQENEELTMTVAKQTSMVEKLKKDAEQMNTTKSTKSPSVLKKSHKIGKENNQIIVSPLRERNH